MILKQESHNAVTVETSDTSIISKIEFKGQNIPLFEFGLYIVLFIFFTILTSTLLFIVHISISPVSLIMGIES